MTIPVANPYELFTLTHFFSKKFQLPKRAYSFRTLCQSLRSKVYPSLHGLLIRPRYPMVPEKQEIIFVANTTDRTCIVHYWRTSMQAGICLPNAITGRRQ